MSQRDTDAAGDDEFSRFYDDFPPKCSKRRTVLRQKGVTAPDVILHVTMYNADGYRSQQHGLRGDQILQKLDNLRNNESGTIKALASEAYDMLNGSTTSMRRYLPTLTRSQAYDATLKKAWERGRSSNRQDVVAQDEASMASRSHAAYPYKTTKSRSPSTPDPGHRRPKPPAEGRAHMFNNVSTLIVPGAGRAYSQASGAYGPVPGQNAQMRLQSAYQSPAQSIDHALPTSNEVQCFDPFDSTAYAPLVDSHSVPSMATHTLYANNVWPQPAVCPHGWPPGEGDCIDCVQRNEASIFATGPPVAAPTQNAYLFVPGCDGPGTPWNDPTAGTRHPYLQSNAQQSSMCPPDTVSPYGGTAQGLVQPELAMYPRPQGDSGEEPLPAELLGVPRSSTATQLRPNVYAQPLDHPSSLASRTDINSAWKGKSFGNPTEQSCRFHGLTCTLCRCANPTSAMDLALDIIRYEANGSKRAKLNWKAIRSDMANKYTIKCGAATAQDREYMASVKTMIKDVLSKHRPIANEAAKAANIAINNSERGDQYPGWTVEDWHSSFEGNKEYRRKLQDDLQVMSLSQT